MKCCGMMVWVISWTMQAVQAVDNMREFSNAKTAVTESMLKCLNCTLHTHRMLPLHCIGAFAFLVTWCETCQLTTPTQQWNGLFVVKTTLQTLGLHYQLGQSGAPCPCPQAGPKNFIIFNISSPHHLAIDYCQCSDEPLSNWVQLL